MSTAQQRKYQSVLVQMMSYLDRVIYGKETEFSNDRHIELMLEDIIRCFYFETFGAENLKEDEKQRRKLRSS